MKNLLFLVLLLLFVSSAPAATPGFDTLVNYDTAWTYVYDGGKQKDGTAINDYFYDVKCLTSGVCVCVGVSGDTISTAQSLLVKLDANGKVLLKKLFITKNTVYTYYNNQTAHSLAIAKNGDFLIGGERFNSPWLMRIDSLGNIRWTSWYYDSTKEVSGSHLQGKGVINSLRESSRGTIICAAGDPYPNNGGSPLDDYAAYLEFDSLGVLKHFREWSAVTGYNIGGFSIEETSGKNILLAGNQAVFYLDSVGRPQWQTKYSFQLAGVGSEDNNINRVKVLRDNTPIVMGQAYEADCWTRYGKLYYDAWWSPIDYAGGLNTNWYTAGFSGGDDHLYDFTQLNNGNLVFVGNSSDYATGGVWVFVKDALGMQTLWQKQFRIPYKTADGRAPRPLSVCATTDSGFTVVGDYACNDSNGGVNALAAHFVPKPITAVVLRSYSALKSVNGFNVHIAGTKLVVSGNVQNQARSEVSLFDVTGKRVAMQALGAKGSSPLSIDISKLARGMYFVRVKTGATEETMLIRVILLISVHQRFRLLRGNY